MPSLSIAPLRYTISQLSRQFGVTPRALRFYEQIGLVEPNRDGPNRVYSRGDCQRIRVITSGRKAGLTLDHIKELLDLYDTADGGAAQIGKAIERLRERVADLDVQREIAAASLTELELRLERVRTGSPSLGQDRFAPRLAADVLPRRAAR